MKKFVFTYGGHRQEYKVVFDITIDGDILSDCSCASGKPCKHIKNLLIGRTEKVRHNEVQHLKDLINLISLTEPGRQMIQEARVYFQEETSCRRCNSKDIIDTKQKTFSARFYKMVSRHRYYCKNCKWSW